MANSKKYFDALTRLLRDIRITDRVGNQMQLEDGLDHAVRLISQVQMIQGKVILVGNGGSAAIASHMQMDLCNACGIPAQVFHEQPQLTALSNDYGYPSAFEKCVRLWASAGDLLIAISSSGKSENILRAAAAARRRGCRIVTLSGFDQGNPLRKFGELNLFVHSSHYGLVELAHAVISHYLTDAVCEFSRKQNQVVTVANVEAAGALVSRRNGVIQVQEWQEQ